MTTILVGDIGGTKVNLAVCSSADEGVEAINRYHRRYSSTQFSGLAEIIERYLQELGLEAKSVEAACFGIPGPVIAGRCVTVNLPWILDERSLENETGLRKIKLINDLEAAAHGVSALEEGAGLVSLRAPDFHLDCDDRRGTQALIAPGTGLGEAILFWDEETGQYSISASEGGHCDFGPQNEEQIDLLRWLWQRHKHASWEHVASGSAIHRLYRFLKETGRESEPEDLKRLLGDPSIDPSALIAARAILGHDSICVHALDLWLFFVGAEAGNMALKCMATGGVYIGGGAAVSLLALFQRPAFLEGFEGKGRMKNVLRPIPILVITDSHVGLYGATFVARRMISLTPKPVLS